jgi:hypothetical protein
MGVIHKKVGSIRKKIWRDREIGCWGDRNSFIKGSSFKQQNASRKEQSVDLQRENGLDRIKKKLCHKKN